MVSDFREQGFASVPLKVCLVLKDRGWIFEKMATRLMEHLPTWNVDAKISYLPSPSADVNHWFEYCDLEGQLYSKNTFLITHVDRPAKLYVLKRRLKRGAMGICMSRMTVEQLTRHGIPGEKLCYITPAHDGMVKPRRIVIGITSQIRLDGAKREDILIKMAKTIRLDAFHFEIIGPRWEKIIPQFQAAGATVHYSPGIKDNIEHRKIILKRLATFDYYLYMGFDEGSMGFLDALAAGIPTIVTPQGFHLDINGGITYSFSNALELCAIFQKLAGERQGRIESVSNLTWNEYARHHALVWRALFAGCQSGVNALLHAQDVYTTPLPTRSRGKSLVDDFRFYMQGNPISFREDFLLLWELYTGRNLRKSFLYSFARSIKNLIIKK